MLGAPLKLRAWPLAAQLCLRLVPAPFATCAQASAAECVAWLGEMLVWRHMAPTAPDTLDVYPALHADPFVIDASPHVFFAGNQAAFAAKKVAPPPSGRAGSLPTPHCPRWARPPVTPARASRFRWRSPGAAAGRCSSSACLPSRPRGRRFSWISGRSSARPSASGACPRQFPGQWRLLLCRTD